jgi:hypothetical protein
LASVQLSLYGSVTTAPFYLELLAQSRMESAYFVVARRGKNAYAPSSSARRRAISRRSQLRKLG